MLRNPQERNLLTKIFNETFVLLKNKNRLSRIQSSSPIGFWKKSANQIPLASFKSTPYVLRWLLQFWAWNTPNTLFIWGWWNLIGWIFYMWPESHIYWGKCLLISIWKYFSRKMYLNWISLLHRFTEIFGPVYDDFYVLIGKAW